MGLLLTLPGHTTFRQLSRYRADHERTFARWYARDVDFVSLHEAAIIQVIPPAHEQALVLDAGFVPNSGKKADGRERFVKLAKREARQHNGDVASVLSMVHLKRRAFNQHLNERIFQ